MPLAPELIKFEAVTMELEIYCEDEVWLGYHTVRVTYNFQDYLDGWSLTSDFTLNVQPEPL